AWLKQGIRVGEEACVQWDRLRQEVESACVLLPRILKPKDLTPEQHLKQLYTSLVEEQRWFVPTAQGNETEP
ncbi:MAG: hypothetical protein AAGJ35_16205, partial [Myxococcota bacterium]